MAQCMTEGAEHIGYQHRPGGVPVPIYVHQGGHVCGMTCTSQPSTLGPPGHGRVAESPHLSQQLRRTLPDLAPDNSRPQRTCRGPSWHELISPHWLQLLSRGLATERGALRPLPRGTHSSENLLPPRGSQLPLCHNWWLSVGFLWSP